MEVACAVAKGHKFVPLKRPQLGRKGVSLELDHPT
jgi:hypothetical protein